MARFIPPHPKKGSPEAKAWAARMQAARKKKIRALGSLREAQYFGPGGHVTGAALHKKKKVLSHRQALSAAEALAAHERASIKRNPQPSIFVYKGELFAIYDSFPTVSQAGAQAEWFNTKAGTIYPGGIQTKAIVIKSEILGKPEFFLYVRPARLPKGVVFDPGTNTLRQTAKNPGRPHGTFTRCVKDVKQSLKHYRKKGDPAAICGAAISKKRKHNPIALAGNPPGEVRAHVEGVLYNRVLEIGAQKTAWRKGKYMHEFGPDAQILALDNGDLLIHSSKGKRLWKKD